MNTYSFRKMNGLGNDFAVFDARGTELVIDAAMARRISDRRSGIGCDQVITIENSERADAFMRIVNADGSEVGACGNATRCVAGILTDQSGRNETVIETSAGLLQCEAQTEGIVTVDMGTPRLSWDEIPLAHAFPDTVDLDICFDGGEAEELRRPGAVNMGNPHCVFFVEDAGAFDLERIGPQIERDPIFPERVNVSLAETLGTDRLRLRVWERGAGLTKACGTAACAAAIAAARRGITGRRVTVTLPGGNLGIEWRENDGHVLMTGPWTLDYEGVFDFTAHALAS